MISLFVGDGALGERRPNGRDCGHVRFDLAWAGTCVPSVFTGQKDGPSATPRGIATSSVLGKNDVRKGADMYKKAKLMSSVLSPRGSLDDVREECTVLCIVKAASIRTVKNRCRFEEKNPGLGRGQLRIVD